MSAPTYRLLIGGPLNGKVMLWDDPKIPGRGLSVRQFAYDISDPEVETNIQDDIKEQRMPYRTEYGIATYEAREIISNGLKEMYQPPSVTFIAIYRE